MGLPLVAVGFMYPGGYLRQRIRVDGWQEDVGESDMKIKGNYSKLS
ncbi:MAG: hypothetical protein AB1797_10155 [bacterium]